VAKPQTTLERMQQNVAQIAQERRQLAENKKRKDAIALDELESLSPTAEQEQYSQLVDLITQRDSGESTESEPAPGPLDSMDKDIEAIGEQFLPKGKGATSEDRRDRREARKANRTSLKKLAAAGFKGRRASDIQSVMKNSSEMPDTGPSVGAGMSLTTNTGRSSRPRKPE
jgi:hypothetical protein